MTPNSDLRRHENLPPNSKYLARLYNSFNNREGDMLGPPCLHRAQQLNQRRICICPTYHRGYKFPPYTLALRWQDWAPSTHRDGQGADWVAGNVANSDTISLTNMGTVCVNGSQYAGWAVWMSLAIGWNPKLNQTRPEAAFEKSKKPIKVWLCGFFCWHSTSQPKWCVTARNIILIYYLILPAPSYGVIMHYELQWGSGPLRGRTVDHSSQELTSRSHEDSPVEIRLILLTPVARGRETQRENRV